MLGVELTQNIQGSGLNSDSLMAGLDLITTIQILLVKDYDNQLRGIQRQMKGAIEVKKAFRQDIEELQKILTKSSKKIDDKFYVEINTPSERAALNRDNNHVVDPITGEKISHKIPYEKPEGKDGNTFFENNFKEKDRKQYIEKDQINNKIEEINQRLERVNEQSEITSLTLQSLTNQRKIAFETVSNLVRKGHDTISTMVRNMNG